MEAQERHKLKEALRKTKWAEKNKTGKKATKKQLAEALLHIVNFMPKERSKENWQGQKEPKSIKEILTQMQK